MPATDKFTDEEILEPDLPIIDPHHHLWFVPQLALAEMKLDGPGCAGALGRIYGLFPSYLADEYLADVATGHRIVASVFIEVHTMYRNSGPEHLRSVGEVEFANGMAAMGASGLFGDMRLCGAIIGGVDLSTGDGAAEILEAHVAAGGGRYRGVRVPGVAFDAALPELTAVLHSRPGVLRETRFRDGFRHLARLGLHYEAWLLQSQLDDVRDLARAFPDTQIVLNHVGGIIGFGPYALKHAEHFPAWRKSISKIAQSPNVLVKLGGLGNPLCGLPSSTASQPYSSRELAHEWRPYLESCIEAFGPDRCMFESNFPVDKITASYDILWNCFKQITSGASDDEKRLMYHDTAAHVYKLDP